MTLAGKAAVLRGRISTDEDLSDFMNFFFANFFDDPSFHLWEWGGRMPRRACERRWN